MTEVLKGISAVSGVGIGRAVFADTDVEKALSNYIAAAVPEERRKYRSACRTAIQETDRSIASAKEKGLTEQAAIMEAHKLIIADPAFEAIILEKIGNTVPAPLAVLQASGEIALQIESLDDPYLRERGADIKDVGKKIARLILGVRWPDFSEGDIILCGNEIEPSLIAGVPDGKVAGIVMSGGSLTSHAVIIAKARGIATVVGIGDQLHKLKDREEVILDGNRGEILTGAPQALIDEYRSKAAEEKKQLEYYYGLSKIPAVTKDGARINLAANIGNPADIDAALKFGCDGVGLFRTEFVYMGRNSLPQEEDQFEAYKFVVEKCRGRLCVIRTMDIGGDKPLPYLQLGREENPFLGFRAIRICLERPDIFITQIKAILRAGVYGKAAIMLPMIVSVEELREAKSLIDKAKEVLTAEGKEYSGDVEIGIMIETPAAAVMADALAKECDFFSIGTNDLVQYTLAADRGNPNVSGLYNYYNPAVLRLIEKVIRAAHANNIWVGLCGEMAGDPAAAKLLIAMGIDELSMSAPSIPKVKEMILGTSIEKETALNVLSLAAASEVTEYMRSGL